MTSVEDRTRTRIAMIGLLVLSLLAVLLARLWFLQVLAGDRFVEASARNSVRIVRTEAPRGRILDRKGRVLVDNRTTHAVIIRRDYLPRDTEQARVVKRRLADLLGIKVSAIDAKLSDVRVSPYGPTLIADDVSEDVIFTLSERSRFFPGVETTVVPVRVYPHGRLASHILGYVGEINETELAEKAPEYALGDQIGRTGVESTYEKQLRGTPGLQKLIVDASGRVLDVLANREAIPGRDLMLTIDAKAQRVAEQALREGMLRARGATFAETGERFKAPAGAVVVLDPRDGDVIAMASLPMYDVRRFVGGVSQEYWDRVNGNPNNPLLNRAIQTSYPPGSTIKPLFATAALETGRAAPGGRYPCTTEFRFGDTVFRNWKTSNAQITLTQSLVESCDTVYYTFARDWWFTEENQIDAGREPYEVMQDWALRFGLGSFNGIDLPQEVAGRVPGREWKLSVWESNKEEYCRTARRTNSVLFEDLCERGYLWRGGDAVNMSIGQGDLEATPLQMATAYGAIANGGTVLQPHVGRRILAPDGEIVREIVADKLATIKASRPNVRYVQRALEETAVRGTAAYPYRGWPLGSVGMAGKTGSAEIAGKQPFSWFASYGPTRNPRYVAVAVVEQAGFGSQVAGPVVRRVMDHLFGRTPLPIIYGSTRSD